MRWNSNIFIKILYYHTKKKKANHFPLFFAVPQAEKQLINNNEYTLNIDIFQVEKRMKLISLSFFLLNWCTSLFYRLSNLPFRYKWKWSRVARMWVILSSRRIQNVEKKAWKRKRKHEKYVISAPITITKTAFTS